MIFYFTGTGNSLEAARKIAANDNDLLISIADSVKNGNFDYNVSETEAVGFVFPVYFYGIPSIVLEFIHNLNLHGYNPETYTFTVFTCGGGIGNAMNMFINALKKRSYHVDSGFSVVMPDNYIILFNLLTPEKRQPALLKQAEGVLGKICGYISNREKGRFILKKGHFPWLATLTNYPFYKYGRSTKPFHHTSACIGCGLCEEICPSSMIHIVENAPVWDAGRCTQCLACIHRCPVGAIQYGKKTYKRGRYINPNL